MILVLLGIHGDRVFVCCQEHATKCIYDSLNHLVITELEIFLYADKIKKVILNPRHQLYIFLIQLSP